MFVFSHHENGFTHLRFDLSLRLAHKAIRPLVQLTRGRLVYLNVAILVAPHLFGNILVHKWAAGRRQDDEPGYKNFNFPQSEVEQLTASQSDKPLNDFSPPQRLLQIMYTVMEKHIRWESTNLFIVLVGLFTNTHAHHHRHTS